MKSLSDQVFFALWGDKEGDGPRVFARGDRQGGIGPASRAERGNPWIVSLLVMKVS